MGKPFFTIQFFEVFNLLRKKGQTLSSKLLLWLSVAGSMLSIYTFGFYLSPELYEELHNILAIIVRALFMLLLFRFLVIKKKEFILRNWLASLGLLFFLFVVTFSRNDTLTGVNSIISNISYFSRPVFTYLAIFLVFLSEFSKSSLAYLKPARNPATLILFSFAILIFIGTGLLLLPRSTVSGISIIDAFFTATSAVCVTGLVVVDTATAFTYFGKWVILLLIQLGGLGIMTFTTFFGYFFRGNISFQSQLALKDAFNDNNISAIYRNIIKIVVFTIAIETFGLVLIYWSAEQFHTLTLFEALFHSISAFCNAGFSTFSQGLSDPRVVHNYFLHLIIAFLVIFGGLGFPVLLNLYNLIKSIIKRVLRRVLRKEAKPFHFVHLVSTSSRLVLYTTFFLLLFGTFFFAVAEWNNSLKTLPVTGKLITAFFASVTPRTAGFNTVNYIELGHAAILLTIVLMWIGASPGSTGGGVKTTTFALALVNAISVARSKRRVEFASIEFPTESIQRAFTVIFISLLVVGISVFCLSTIEKELDFKLIVFECVSAFSTVGLSLGATAKLSIWGKTVLIVTMFIGRLGILTLLIGVFRKSSNFLHRYPEENIYIN